METQVEQQQLRKKSFKAVHHEDEIKITIWNDDDELWDKEKRPRELSEYFKELFWN
jgi:hypothetical protein